MRHGISEALSSHPLAVASMNEASSIIKERYPEYQEFVRRTGELRMDSAVKAMSRLEYYHSQTFYAVSSIVGTTERMENAQLLIRRFPSPRTYLRQGIGYHDWLEYHFGYFLVSMVGLYDSALVLTNTVLALGNQHRNCTTSIVAGNSRVKGTPTGIALKQLDKLMAPYRPVRNTHLHRGYRVDPSEILQSNDLDMFQMISFVSLRDSTFCPKADLDALFGDSAGKMHSAMDVRLGEVQATLSSLFDCLGPIYHRRCELLRSRHVKQV